MSDDVKSVRRTSCNLPIIPSESVNKSIPYPDEVEKQVIVQIRSELQAIHTHLAIVQHFTSENYFV